MPIDSGAYSALSEILKICRVLTRPSDALTKCTRLSAKDSEGYLNLRQASARARTGTRLDTGQLELQLQL